jgi:hypothetical protein
MNYEENEEENEAFEAFDFPQIYTICVGYINSGTLGGSLPEPIRPNVYHYSKFSVTPDTPPELAEEFENMLCQFLDYTQINKAVSLREYLWYDYQDNHEELKKIHENYQITRATGSSRQPLPTLFLTEEGKTLSISPQSSDLKGPGIFALPVFLRLHGTHFQSEIPDEFFATHYPNYVF